MPIMNRRVVLVSRPSGWVQESNFAVEEAPLPVPADGEFLVKNLWLSLDPYMRGRMNDTKSYAPHVELGALMVGATIGQVMESHHPQFAVGDFVSAGLGWQEYGVSSGQGVRKVDPALPLSVYLGAAGMPGVTAYIGLLDIGTPKAGETVVVSAAAGAVGSVVGQIAKIKGCHVVGIAGGPAKCAHVVDDLGFDACVDYKSDDLRQALRAATPRGVDVCFENVGGLVMDLVLARLNAFSRIALCGLVSQYNLTTPYGVTNFGSLLVNRVRLEGFIVSERMQRWPTALAELGEWVREGKIKYAETIAEGITEAPKAFIGMLKGENKGKQLVKLA